MNQKRVIATAIAVIALLATPVMAQTASTDPPPKILIKNVSIFNGTAETLITGKDVVLIYSKNPLKDIAIVGDYENNLKVVVKDGKVYKNEL